MTTPVIFRKEFGDSVIAFFPTLPGNMHISTCQCYAHIGQHSTAHIDYYKGTDPATPDEYKDLLKELQWLGYDLKVYTRWQQNFHTERLEVLRSYGN